MQTKESDHALASDWMLFLARAAVALLLAVAIIATARLDLGRFAGMLGLYAVTEGIFTAIIWLREKRFPELGVEAGLGIAGGLIIMVWGITPERLLLLVSLRALAVAAPQALFARHTHTPGSPWLLCAAAAAALTSLGFLVVGAFGYDALDLYACIAGQLTIVGTLLGIYAFKLRDTGEHGVGHGAHPHAR